jgi:hypothetical protein
MAALPSRREVAEVSGHAPQAAVAAPSGFQPAAARSSALTSRNGCPGWILQHRPPGSEPGALLIELQGNTIRQPELHRSRIVTNDERRNLRFGGVAGLEMERAPGLAPGKSGFASRRLDDFGIARFWKWGGRRVLPPLGDLHRIECWLLHHGLRLKVILRPALPRHGPHYECGALLTSATEECLARKRLTKYAERSPHSRRSGN